MASPGRGRPAGSDGPRYLCGVSSSRPELILLWGVSGAGKSTYCRWLRDTHGYVFVEHDEAAGAGGVRSQADKDWIAMCSGQIPPIGFVQQRRREATVVEVGFRPGAGTLTLLRELIDAGSSAWWFDGDRDGALDNWRRRDKPIDDAFWRVQLGYVDRHWAEIAELFRARIVRSVGPRGATLSAELLDRLIFGPEDD
jgi:hypothetical protein